MLHQTVSSLEGIHSKTEDPFIESTFTVFCNIMPSDNDSLNSSDFSDELVDDEFSNDNMAPKRVDEKEESNDLVDWFYFP